MALTVSLTNPSGTDSCSLVLVENVFGPNTWSTPDAGRLCVDLGEWNKSPEGLPGGAGTFQVLLDNGAAGADNKFVAELHFFNSSVGASGRAAVRCGGSFSVTPSSDPVGLYTWTVIAV
jgi:hypothetical protein